MWHSDEMTDSVLAMAGKREFAAQREAVRVFLAGRADDPAEAFTEIESGKNADRPQLARALDACRLAVRLMAVIAQEEREMILPRIKAAPAYR
jgi:DNA invertase Pin-like site-specific DNA recombinase